MDARKIFNELDELDRIKESVNYISTTFSENSIYYTGACYMLEDLAKKIEKVKQNIINLVKNE